MKARDRSKMNSREDKVVAQPAENNSQWAGAGYQLGDHVDCAMQTDPYTRKANDPLYRPLQIYTIDSSTSQLDGSTTVVQVPYEPLEVGPVGAHFDVDDYTDDQPLRYRRLNLEEPHNLIQNGRMPSVADPEFHQQMVYAVCSLVFAAFRRALGRDLVWGFPPQGTTGPRLRIRPHAREDQNAFYDPNKGELCFGYYLANPESIGRNLPNSYIHTCLSHDIVAHELTHALLDGLRTQFSTPSGPDVIAFHESFADTVAVFQHFTYKEVLAKAIAQAGGELEKASLLVNIAEQFGHTTNRSGPLRTSIEPPDGKTPLRRYDMAGDEPHLRGTVLTSAIFDAFNTLFKRKTAVYMRLATHGSGVLPAGALSVDLQQVLADQAHKLADQFLSICIRAIDYCPPVDLEFGEFLRAVITADRDLVPDDPWAYREAWIDAFQRRRIYPRNVQSLTVEDLVWKAPRIPIPPIRELAFGELHFSGTPGRIAAPDELRRRAHILGKIVAQPGLLEEFGCARHNDVRLRGDQVDPPQIESIRTSQRIGPDGQILYDLVAEVTQRRIVRSTPERAGFEFYGGATVIIDPLGQIRYIISKRVTNQDRLEAQAKFMRGGFGATLWEQANGEYNPTHELFRMLHNSPGKRAPTDGRESQGEPQSE
jgi:hypothetical protein